jgi:hypothetical protein
MEPRNLRFSEIMQLNKLEKERSDHPETESYLIIS